MGCLKLERLEERTPSLEVIHGGGSDRLYRRVSYYPFGLEMNGEWSVNNNTDYNYTYNGKELQRELDLGWYNYGARFYDPSIGRFTGVDPLAEIYTPLTPYNYVNNNPSNSIDPDGRIIIILNDRKQVMKDLNKLAATRIGSKNITSLISQRFAHRIKSIFWTKNSHYDRAGHGGNGKYYLQYSPSVWYPRLDGGDISGTVVLGHELTHALQDPSMTQSSKEYGAMYMGNYFRSVFGMDDMRNTHGRAPGVRMSQKESTYNPGNEQVGNFVEDVSLELENGSSVLGMSYEVSFGGGEKATEYILSITDSNGEYAYRKFGSKEEYDKAVKRAQDAGIK